MGTSWKNHGIFQDIPNGGFNGKFIYQWGDFRCQIFLGISNFKQLDKNMTDSQFAPSYHPVSEPSD